MSAWHFTTAVAILLLASDVFGSDPDSHSMHWAYTGRDDADHWASQFQNCGGSKQSPINLDLASALPQNFLPIYMGNYDTADKTMTLTNNGHTALLSLPKNYPDYRVPYVKDGGLTSQFNFAQLHFHWGNTSDRGSEHTLQAKRYPAELHFVHYNKKYGSFENATSHPDGLAVLGVFVQVNSQDNAAFKPIMDALEKISHEGSDSPLSDNLMLKDLLPASTSKFYRYSGSLTTPGCNEIVVWTVFESPIPISENQLAKFRQLKSEDGPLVNNYRPVQPLMGRTVHIRSSASAAVVSLTALIIPVLAWLAQ